MRILLPNTAEQKTHAGMALEPNSGQNIKDYEERVRERLKHLGHNYSWSFDH